MSYKALISTCHIIPHPNADRLSIAEICGYHVVVAKGFFEEGELVIFFPEGGQLSKDMCYHNSLYREKEGKNINPEKFGYFNSDRRVKTLRLRQEKSEGYAAKLSSLAWTGADLSKLKQGQLIDSLEGKSICNKYYTDATIKAKNKAGGKRIKNIPHFREIGSTNHFRMNLGKLEEGSLIVITEKVHGTSGRTAFLEMVVAQAIKRRWYQVVAGFLTGNGIQYYKVEKHTEKEYISGTRKTICCKGKQTRLERPDGSLIPLGYRQEIHNSLMGCLRDGEALYYEIVFVADNNLPMFRQSIPDNKEWKEVRKKYSNAMHYSYGVEAGAWKIFLYKVTIQNGDGEPIPLCWSQVESRAAELGIETVPVLDRFIYDGDEKALIERVSLLSEGESTLDPSHIREGVCVTVESPKVFKTFKNKGFTFVQLEGIAKGNKAYIDPEEVS